MRVSPRSVSVLAGLVLACLSASPAAAQTSGSKLDRVLRDAIRSQATVPQRVIVQTRPGTREDVKRTLKAHGDVIAAEHPALDALTVTVHHEDLATLAAHPAVVSVSADVPVTSFGQKSKTSTESYGREGDGRTAPYHTLNVLRGSLGVDGLVFRGAGVRVAIVDSGIEANRDLAPAIAGFWDFTKGGIPTAPYDDYGHGTHVAGLIGSRGDESNNEFAGVAPAVQLYGLKVLDKFGRGRASDVIRALEWVAANKRSDAPGAVKIDVVNLSLGHPVYEPAATDPLVRAVENLARAGVVVVVAAGNNGQDPAGDHGYAGVSSPGNSPSALTVGATDTQNTVTRSDDRVAYFSSRGPTWFDAFAKPEIVAPGVGLTSDVAERGELYAAYPQLRLSGRFRKFARLSGTSVAAATATGVAALALEASRFFNHGKGLTPNAIKAVLQYTAVPVDQSNGEPFEPLAQGAGQINGRGAVALASVINTEMSIGQSWLRLPIIPISLIGGRLHAWSRTLIWNDSAIQGSDVLSINSHLWDDNIVWGTDCDTDDAHCVATVWGSSSDVDNIVWGTGLSWASDIVFSNRVIGLFLGEDNIVWGTLAGLSEDNIVWGTFADDNIVWGTFLNGDNIVWGTDDLDNIVWGTLSRSDDNIVWGTLRTDNSVWGTLDGRQEGGRR